MPDRADAFTELPRLSATRFGPLPTGGDPMRLYRYDADGRPSMLHAIHGPENPYVDPTTGAKIVEYMAHGDGTFTFTEPQLTFSCHCVVAAIERWRKANPKRVDSLIAAVGDLTLTYERTYPGELPHTPECFHRIFCRVEVSLDVALSTIAERVTTQANEATDRIISQAFGRA